MRLLIPADEPLRILEAYLSCTASQLTFNTISDLRGPVPDRGTGEERVGMNTFWRRAVRERFRKLAAVVEKFAVILKQGTQHRLPWRRRTELQGLYETSSTPGMDQGPFDG